MSSSGCLPAEALALMIDGKASQEDRSQWMPHLNECIDCRTLLAEAATYVEDTGVPSTGPQGSSVSLLYRQTPLFALAAVLLVGILSFSLLDPLNWFGSGESIVQSLSSSTASTPLLVADTDLAGERWDPNDRGLGLSSSLDDRKRAFRIGVYLVDLRVSLHEAAYAETLATLELVTALVDEPAELIELRASLGSGEQARAVEALDALEDRLRAVLPADDVSFGNWVEAARLAAVGNQPEVFTNVGFSETLIVFREQAASEPIAKALTEIEISLTSNLDRASLSNLQRELRRIVLLN